MAYLLGIEDSTSPSVSQVHNRQFVSTKYVHGSVLAFRIAVLSGGLPGWRGGGTSRGGGGLAHAGFRDRAALPGGGMRRRRGRARAARRPGAGGRGDHRPAPLARRTAPRARR